ncbi:hypothetical protein NA57DRAFT_46599 [Rhizodiscina lignyota]|uniref:Acyltransferase 3 domain-containing protein n=1 Tax=Rhizodiscina lignyota TaxID=1504668 RepID=A0A9P4M2E7_9PEZI|nr:hypothetical protein NA57DRAFT_46599 [Rhizodiscina lignyota]
MSSSFSDSDESAPFLEHEKESVSPSYFSQLAFLSWAAARIRRVCEALKRCRNLTLPHLYRTACPPRETSSENISPPSTSTAWLDGMRGFASFFVYIRHFASATHTHIEFGYGQDEENHFLIQLPFLRLVVGGPAMVALFFIISGYALSWAPLRSMHYESASKGLERLASGVFRRAIRLFMPGIVSTFLVMLCISMGLYDTGKAAVNDVDMPGFQEPGPPMLRKDPFVVQFRDWVQCTWKWLNVWKLTSHPYDVHTWTLPVEFSSSMALFLVLVAFSKCAPTIRLCLLASSVIYCHLKDNWTCWLFFAGSFLAQLKIIQDSKHAALSDCHLPTTETHANSMKMSRRIWAIKGDIARVCLFIAGLYLLSAPDFGAANDTPGYITLSRFIPSTWPESYRFLHCIGALLAVYATSSTSTSSLRCLFDNAFSTYLGKLSYAIYLVHGPVVHMLGFWLVPWCWSLTGKETMWDKEFGFMIAFIIVTIVVLRVADWFWRYVDAKCVLFARWVEKIFTGLG